MKARLLRDFAWSFDGIRPTHIAAGEVVDEPVARNAVSVGAAEYLDESPAPAKALPEPVNKALPGPKNKAAPRGRRPAR